MALIHTAMGTWYRLILLLTWGSLCYAQPDTSVCTPLPSSASPSLPPLPERFSMRAEANLISKNNTIDVHEWHDGPGNRGAANTWLSSVKLSYIYSYDTNEMFFLEQEADGIYACQVKPLDSIKQPYLHGTDNSTASKNSNNGSASHIYSTAAALSFGGAVAEHYAGRTTVRGMLTDHWTSCVYWSDLNATMTVSWYFTAADEWDSAVGRSQTPVRCHVKGKVHTGSTSRNFEHMYEVTEFYSYLSEGTQVFQPPEGTLCPGRKNTKPLPTFPPVFYLSRETVSKGSNSTAYGKLAYDSELKLIMQEFPTRLSYARDRDIYDFNTGLVYAVDGNSGTCSVRSIESHSAGVISSGAAVRMSTPQELLFGNYSESFTYEGIREERQLNTEGWLGQHAWQYHQLDSNISWQVNVLTPEWHVNGLTTQSTVPVSMQQASASKQFKTFINMYDFRDDDPLIWSYDITSCYNDSQLRSVQLSFPVTSAQLQLVSTNQVAFRKAVLNSVTSLVTMSPMRVTNIQLQFRPNEVGVTMVIAEAVNVTLHVQLANPMKQPSLTEVVAKLHGSVVAQRFAVHVNTSSGPLSLVATVPSTTASTMSATTSTTIATASAPTTSTTNKASAPTPTTNTASAPTPTTTTTSAPTTTTTSAPTTTSKNSRVVSPSSTPSATGAAHGTSSGGSPVLCTPQSSGYTKGDVAGVSMGMAFGGYVLALLSLSLWSRWRSSVTFNIESTPLEMS